MNNVVAYRPQANALTNFTPKQLDLIKRTVAADCNAEEFDLYMQVCNLTKLNPFRKQIFAVVYSKDDPKKRKMSIITSIDGYRAIAARNRDYRPNDEATTFEQDDALISPENPKGLIRAITKCWKLGQDNQWYTISGEARWDEFAPIKDSADEYDWVDTGEKWANSGKPKMRKVPKPGTKIERVPDGKWASMPHIMLSKCAESQALRKGWPEELSGVYVAEEFDRARVDDMTASEAVEAYERDKRLMLTNTRDCVTVQWAPTEPLEAVPVGLFADRAAAYVRACQSLPDLDGWKETNRVALQDFWGRAKGDALELKKIIEAREKEIATANREPKKEGALL